MRPLEKEEEDDPWPDEPDEFDPHSLGPEIPSVDPPSGDVDRETFLAFWGAVLSLNVGLLLPSLGLMVWYFEGMATVGALLMAAGAASLYRTYRTYRGYVDGGDE